MRINKVYLILISFFTFFLSAYSQGLPSYGPSESLGVPIRSIVVNDAAYGKEAGREVLYTTTSGKPARFQVLDYLKKKVLRSFELKGSESSWTHLRAPNGKVYIGGNGLLYEYDPRQRKVKSLGGFGEKAIYGLSIDGKGRIYFGTYPKAKIGRYNPNTDELEDLGSIAPGQKYARSTATYKDNVFAGIGTDNRISQMNLSSKKLTQIDLPKGIPHGSSVWQLNVVGDLLIAGVGGGDNTLLIYDLKNATWLPYRFKDNKGMRLIQDPDVADWVYFLQKNRLMKLDLSDFSLKYTGHKYGASIKNYTWIETDQVPWSGKSLVLLYNTGKITFLSREGEKKVSWQLPLIGGDIPIQSLERDNQGNFHMSGYPGGVGALYYPDTGEFENFTLGQAEGMVAIKDTMYYGIYAKARIYKKHKKERAKYFFKIPNQDRPFVMKNFDQKLFVGTIPGYGKLGGDLTVIDPAYPKASKTFKNLIKNQSLAGLAKRGDTLFGSTTIAGGLGVDPTAKAAVVFQFDLENEKIIRKVQPLDKEVGMISGLHFGPNGSLWAAANGQLIELDPKTLELIRAKNLYPKRKRYGRWRPAQFRYTRDGDMITSLGGYLSVVNPKTLNFNKLDTTELFHLDENDNLYYVKKTELLYRKMEPNVRDLGEMLHNISIPGADYGFFEGEPVIYAISGGEPAQFNIIDAQSGVSLQSFDLPGASNAWAITIAPGGKVYVGSYPQGKFYEYDPKLNQLKDRGQALKGESWIWRMDTDPQGVVYGGTYPGGNIFSYDSETDKFSEIGTPDPHSKYVRSIAAGEDSIYVGLGTKRAKLMIMDKNDGGTREISLPSPYDEETLVYDLSLRGHLLFLRISEKSDILIYDLRTDKFEKIIPDASGLEVSPISPDGNKVYLSIGDNLHSFDLQTMDIESTPFKNFGTSRNFGWFQGLESDKQGWWLVSISHDGMIRKYHPSSKAVRKQQAKISGGPVSIQSILTTKDQKVYVGGYFSGSLGIYNIQQNKKKQFDGIGQIEGMTQWNNQVIFGVYTGAEIFSYDPKNSEKFSFHPKKLFDLRSYHQDRPFAMTQASGDLFIGTVPGYGKLGGILVRYNKKGKNVFELVSQNQSIISMAPFKQQLWLGTSVWGGLGIAPTEKEAEIVLWDVNKNRVKKRLHPLPGEKAYSALHMEPNGQLWGLSLGKIFKYDTKEDKLLFKKELFPVNWQNIDHLWRAGKILKSKNGDLIVYAKNRIYRVDTQSYNVQMLIKPVSLLSMDAKGCFYFARGARLYQYNP